MRRRVGLIELGSGQLARQRKAITGPLRRLAPRFWWARDRATLWQDAEAAGI